ncbi:MAG: iron-sulfur cluster assembly scaffold protein [Candidatus Altiarchaeia archaeon]
MYSKDVMEHFMHPQNVGEMQDADGVGEVGNPVCGDIMWIYIKVKDERIEDIKFKTLGCAAAIATSSKVTELAKGRTLDSALGMSNKEIVDSLGGLPPVKVHCSLLAVDGLKEAIYDYYKKNGRAVTEKMEKEHQKIKAEKCETNPHSHNDQ